MFPIGCYKSGGGLQKKHIVQTFKLCTSWDIDSPFHTSGRIDLAAKEYMNNIPCVLKTYFRQLKESIVRNAFSYVISRAVYESDDSSEVTTFAYKDLDAIILGDGTEGEYSGWRDKNLVEDKLRDLTDKLCSLSKSVAENAFTDVESSVIRSSFFYIFILLSFILSLNLFHWVTAHGLYVAGTARS